MNLSDEDINRIVNLTADRVYARMESEGVMSGAPLIVGVDGLAKYLSVNKAWVYGRMKSLPISRLASTADSYSMMCWHR